MAIAVLILLLFVLGNLFALALCRAAKEADDAMDRLYLEAGTEVFDR